MNNGYELIVDRLIIQRKKLNWSQEELAHRIGCATSLIHKWEQYKRMPSGFMLGCWVESLGLQITVSEKETEQRTGTTM